MNDAIYKKVTKVTKTIVKIQNISLADKWRGMKKKIKRAILDQSFGDPSLVKIVQERFMELGKTKFGGNNKDSGR